MKSRVGFVILMVIVVSQALEAQEGGRLSGNFQVNAQVYKPDSLIGMPISDMIWGNFRPDCAMRVI
jgi:hypothetical protein